MSRHITVKIVPEVISGNWEEEIMFLHHDETILTLEIIRLTISPVKPFNSLVHVRPEPLSWGIGIMTLLRNKVSSNFIDYDNLFIYLHLCKLQAKTVHTRQPL